MNFQLIINLLFLVCFDIVFFFIYFTKIQERCQESVQGTKKG